MDTDRRKLVLGSAAVPLILTVSPAVAQTRTSFGACLERDARRQKPNQVLASPGDPDEWMRIRVDLFQLAVWDEPKREWRTLENRQFMVGVDRSTYWELDHFRPDVAPASPTAMTKGIGIRETKIGERFALAYVGREGELLGYGWEPQGGTHCTRSCWTSVAPK
jgi:hypothetical protein